MVGSTKTLDALARDQRIAPDWVEALRRVDPAIDGKVDACLTKVSDSGPYLPEEGAIWRAFKVPLADIRVLILGQDPYPNPSHAVGLSFSTGPGGPIPASLRNIHVELDECGYRAPNHGDLSAWSEQGVMLLNRALTLPLNAQARPRRHFRWWAPIVTSAGRRSHWRPHAGRSQRCCGESRRTGCVRILSRTSESSPQVTRLRSRLHGQLGARCRSVARPHSPGSTNGWLNANPLRWTGRS